MSYENVSSKPDNSELSDNYNLAVELLKSTHDPKNHEEYILAMMHLKHCAKHNYVPALELLSKLNIPGFNRH